MLHDVVRSAAAAWATRAGGGRSGTVRFVNAAAALLLGMVYAFVMMMMRMN